MKHSILLEVNSILQDIKNGDIYSLPEKRLHDFLLTFNGHFISVYKRNKKDFVRLRTSSRHNNSYKNKHVTSQWDQFFKQSPNLIEITQDIYIKKIKTTNFLDKFNPVKTNDIIIPIVNRDKYKLNSTIDLVVFIRIKYVFNKKRIKRLFIYIQKLIQVFYDNIIISNKFEDELSFTHEIANFDGRNVDNLYSIFLKKIHTLISAKFIDLWIYNELDDKLALRSFFPHNIDGQKVEFNDYDTNIIDKNKSLTGFVFSSGSHELFNDVLHKEYFSNPNFAAKYGLKSLISFPIFTGSKKIAILNIFSENIINIEPDSALRIHNYVMQVANITKVSSILFEQDLTKNYDEFLNLMLTFKHEKENWDNIAKMISNKMECEACSIFMLQEGSYLELIGSTGIIGDPLYSNVKYDLDQPSLTAYAFKQTDPFVYYKDDEHNFKEIHISKYREKLKLPGRGRSILYMKIINGAEKPIGIIRCNNKTETASLHIGKFTKEDVFKLTKISQIISHIYDKVNHLKNLFVEKERSLLSLHHELLAPIDGINSHLEWIKRFMYKNYNLEVNPRLALKIEDIRNNGKLMDMLVSSLGKWDLNSKLKKEEFSLPLVLNQCKYFCISDAKMKNININIGFLEPKIEADQHLLMRVFYNLIRNAIKYSDVNEPIRYLKISTYVHNSMIDITFTDNGIGVHEGDEELIFEKFKRGSNAYQVFPEGTGLGLAFCKKIIMEHNGNITLKKLRKPTVFEISLPIKVRLS